MLPPIKRRVKVFVARADPRGGDRFQAAGRSGGLGLDLAHIAWAGAEPALKFRGPGWRPGRDVRGDQKNLQPAKKFKRGPENFCGHGGRLVNRSLARPGVLTWAG
jgi:hypothetical protein